MLKIKREYTGAGGIRVRMTGHADAARNEHNHDLVCAAASVLCYTLADTMERYCVHPVCKLEPGNALLHGTPKTLNVSYFRAAYEAVMVGFELLATQYPEHVEVSEWF